MMPPKRRKRATIEENVPLKRQRKDDVIGMKLYYNDSEEFSSKKCETWFKKYAETMSTEPMIGPEGVEKFCADLGVHPEDIVVLVIAWQMEAVDLGFFKLEEWNSGMGILRCDTIHKLKSQLGTLRAMLHDPATFKKIYRYAFDFCRDKAQRSLDMETAKAMLKLLLTDVWNDLPAFLEFLDTTKYKVMNRDQWNSLLEFIRSVNSFSNYDMDGAWPVLLDEFVAWSTQGAS